MDFWFWNLTTVKTTVWKLKFKFYILILNFQISLPPIPQFKNKSFNFIFSFWIFKSYYHQYHSLKIKVLISYSHFGFSNLTTVNTTIKIYNLKLKFNSKALKTSRFNVFTFYNLEKRHFLTGKVSNKCTKSSSQFLKYHYCLNLYIFA